MQVGFLIAGVQKAGTTALNSFLRQHKGLAMSSRKEVHFFDDESIDWTQPNYADYHKFFGPDNGRLFGESTPIYSYWTPAPERIHEYNRNMRIILCLRDPVARAYSHWEMEVSRGYDELAFGEAIREGRKRVAESEDSEFGCHRVYSYVERGFYAPQIKKLLTFFPRDQLLFVENNRLRKEHKSVLDEVCDFLKVDRFINYPAFKNVLPTKKRKDLGDINEDDAAFLSNLYAQDTRETASLTGLDVTSWRSCL